MRVVTMFLALIGVILTTGGEVRAEAVERRVRLMGTEFSLRIEADRRADALDASARAVAAAAAAESRLSTWTPDSEMSRFNASPAGTPAAVSPFLARDLAAARRCAVDTDGAFSPGLGALVDAWGLRRGGRRPDPELIEALLPAARVKNLELGDGTATRLDDGFVVEEGAFGKGVGLDDASDALAATRATGAVFNLGGQVAVWGSASARVEIADPRDRERAVLGLAVGAGSVATSGNSERGIVVDGERLGHLLDPASGRPAPDFGSVTVWAPSAVRADCLATALYAMGPEHALRWAAARPEIAAIVIENEAGRLRARATANLRGRLVPLAAALDLSFDDAPARDGKQGGS